MNINETIVSALEDLGLPIAESLYEGDDEEFLTFKIADTVGADHGDNDPEAITYFVQVHYVCPWEADYKAKRRAIRKALKAADFTYPDITDMSDSDARIRHFIFETQIDNNYDLEEDE